jgi:hypothetical protein
MKIALSIQPIGVGVDANNQYFSQYTNGVVTSTDCYKS